MTDTKLSMPPLKPIKPVKFGVRHYQYVLYGITLVVFHGISSSLSVVIVPMTGEDSSEVNVPEKVDWSGPDTVLSAFFWAYFIPHISGAKLTEMYPPRWLLVISMLIGSIFNIGIPVMNSSYGQSGVVGCRVIQGICQGFLYPGLTSLINGWSPISERTNVTTLVFGCCTSLGIAICMPLTGYLAEIGKGWPFVFYFFGVVGLIWTVIFGICCRHSPDKHKSITEDEKRYIENTVDVEIRLEQNQGPTPWVHIIKSVPVWAVLAAGSAHCWGAYTLLTQIPSYMSSIMNYDIAKDGDLSGVPYFAQLAITLIIVPLSDKLISKKTSNTTTIRKVFTGLGTFIPAIFLTALAFIDSSQKKEAVAFLVITVATSVFAQSGYLLNIVDMAPKHAATLFSVLNATTTVFSALGPLTVGFLGNDKKDPILWRNVFLISASIYTVCGIVYCWFASAEEQEWNDIDDEDIIVTVKKFITKWYANIKKRINCFEKLQHKKIKLPSVCSRLSSLYEEKKEKCVSFFSRCSYYIKDKTQKCASFFYDCANLV